MVKAVDRINRRGRTGEGNREREIETGKDRGKRMRERERD